MIYSIIVSNTHQPSDIQAYVFLPINQSLVPSDSNWTRTIIYSLYSLFKYKQLHYLTANSKSATKLVTHNMNK